MASAAWNVSAMGPDSAEIKELAARICRDYLKGPWKHVTAQNIGFKHISGGLSNFLYQVSLPSPTNQTPDTSKTSDVLIRVYGPTHGDRGIEHMITESVVFTLLSERGLGPRLLGLFPGGRVEQYINARPLRTRELSDPRLSALIARKMAVVHSMDVPLHKKPGWLWETIDRWLVTAEKQLKNSDSVSDAFKELTQVDFRTEILYLKEMVENTKSPVVFCHNDMQEGNILITQDENENFEGSRLVLIDFEYCSYNYRSYDLANHFIEFTYDYSIPEFPFFKETITDYPSITQSLDFIKIYLDEINSKEDPEKVLREVRVFTLATHFFWCLWSLVNTETPVIPFGYWEYALARMRGYFRTKKELNEVNIKPATKRKLSEVE